jgi:hypothetical protein
MRDTGKAKEGEKRVNEGTEETLKGAREKGDAFRAIEPAQKRFLRRLIRKVSEELGDP